MLKICQKILDDKIWDIYGDCAEEFSNDRYCIHNNDRQWINYKYINKLNNEYGLSVFFLTNKILKILDEEKATLFVLKYA